MIRVEQLRKAYPGVIAVDGVSFEVAAGETFGLLGPNGAGKTTTMQMLVGVLSPDAGTVTIAEAGNPTQAETRRQIGLAPQQLSLYDALTGYENLAFFGRLYGLSGRDLKARVGRALDFAGLSDRARDRVKTYSGGMQRRLNLATALMHDPKVLLLDEPTVGVDPQSRNRIFDNIEALKSEGRTIIYTTHYMEEAQRLCDRVAIMDHGKLLALDTVDALIAQHGGKSVVTARLERPPEDSVVLPEPLDGDSLRFDTAQPLEEVGRLAAAGVKFLTLKIDQPDLETVFLSLTGRRLRD